MADIKHRNAVSCTLARRLVRYGLNHGAVSIRRGVGFATTRKRFLGFRFSFQIGTYDTLTAAKGPARVTFLLCWFNVDC